MLPGPTIIRECPHCGIQMKQKTIISGNTFGATLWSDGKQVAPMLPRPPYYICCKMCRNIIMLQDVRKVAEIEWNERDEKYSKAAFIEFPTFMENIRATEVISDKKLARTMTMYSYNDFSRDHKEDAITPEIQKLHEHNIYELESLLDKSIPEDLIIKAEINRYLGRFDRTAEILESITDQKFDWIRKNSLSKLRKAIRRFSNCPVVNLI